MLGSLRRFWMPMRICGVVVVMGGGQRRSAKEFPFDKNTRNARPRALPASLLWRVASLCRRRAVTSRRCPKGRRWGETAAGQNGLKVGWEGRRSRVQNTRTVDSTKLQTWWVRGALWKTSETEGDGQCWVCLSLSGFWLTFGGDCRVILAK